MTVLKLILKCHNSLNVNTIRNDTMLPMIWNEIISVIIKSQIMGFDKLLEGILHTVVYTCWCVYAFEAQKSSYWCGTGHPVNRECSLALL